MSYSYMTESCHIWMNHFHIWMSQCHDVTPSYMHASWLNHMCDVTYSYNGMRHISILARHTKSIITHMDSRQHIPTYEWAIWLNHMCDVTHSYKGMGHISILAAHTKSRVTHLDSYTRLWDEIVIREYDTRLCVVTYEEPPVSETLCSYTRLWE